MANHILFFAGMMQFTGVTTVQWDDVAGLTIAEIRKRIRQKWPDAANLLSNCRLAINEQYVEDDAIVPIGAVVAVIPPVSGG